MHFQFYLSQTLCLVQATWTLRQGLAAGGGAGLAAGLAREAEAQAENYQNTDYGRRLDKLVARVNRVNKKPQSKL